MARQNYESPAKQEEAMLHVGKQVCSQEDRVPRVASLWAARVAIILKTKSPLLVNHDLMQHT